MRGRSRRTKRLRPRADDIRAQALDIAAVAAFSVLAFVSFFRKSVRLKYVSLVAAVVYLGFYKSQLISIVNVFGLMGGNLPIFRYNLAWYLLAAITAVSTVLWGRVYCGRMRLRRVHPACGCHRSGTMACEHSAHHRTPRLVDQIRHSGQCRRLLSDYEGSADLSVCRAVLDVWLHLRTPVLLTMLGTLLVATVFVRNAYAAFSARLVFSESCRT